MVEISMFPGPDEGREHKVSIMFCLPGSAFSASFVKQWNRLLIYCFEKGISFGVSMAYCPYVHEARNRCLQIDDSGGVFQKPFRGKIDYDFIMWIDNDNIFQPEQFQQLLNHNKDIVAGAYFMEGGEYLATVAKEIEESYTKYARPNYLTLKEIEHAQELIEVEYTGMGFMMVKKGIFESLECPWFQPIPWKRDAMTFFMGEDAGFCYRARKEGFKVFLDPTVRVGHEKKTII